MHGALQTMHAVRRGYSGGPVLAFDARRDDSGRRRVEPLVVGMVNGMDFGRTRTYAQPTSVLLEFLERCGIVKK